jgi:hypothetical protein
LGLADATCGSRWVAASSLRGENGFDAFFAYLPNLLGFLVLLIVGDEEEEREDQPGHHARGAVGRTGTGQHPVDVLVGVRALKVTIHANLVEHLAHDAGEDLGHDEPASGR